MGEKIQLRPDGLLRVPEDPIIPYIEGDGVGPDIWKVSVRVFDEAVKKCYGGKRKVEWLEVLAGEKAHQKKGDYAPEETIKDWGYELAKAEFGDKLIPESEMSEGKVPRGKIVIKDRIADMMFQQILLRPEEYDVLAMPNLNGDYMSDALAAQVGGLGMAPGANIGDEAAVFEATHGSAPKYAGQDVINPGSLILSGAMMFDHLGWSEVAQRITKAMEKTIASKVVTYDLARQMEGAKKVKCSEFANAIIENL
jgi:isocitrate dehydrogenase